jgi:hypothetical protein
MSLLRSIRQGTRKQKRTREENIEIERDVIFFADSKVAANTHFGLKDNHKTALNQFAKEFIRLNRNPKHEMKEIFLDHEHFLGVWSKYNTHPASSGYILLKSYDRALAPLVKLREF